MPPIHLRHQTAELIQNNSSPTFDILRFSLNYLSPFLVLFCFKCAFILRALFVVIYKISSWIACGVKLDNKIIRTKNYVTHYSLTHSRARQRLWICEDLSYDNCRNSHALTGQFSLSKSEQTHEFIIYGTRQPARGDNLTIYLKKTNWGWLFMSLSSYWQCISS